MNMEQLKELSNFGQKTAEAGKKLADACKSQTKEELEFALDKALEVAKEKDREIKVLKGHIMLLDDLLSLEDHSGKDKAKLTISAIIGIAAGFILALILL